MQRFLLLTTMIIFQLTGTAQPYKSIFGAVNTQWTVLIIQTVTFDSLYVFNADYSVEKDTVVNGTTYKLITSPFNNWGLKSRFLLREDTAVGKVWYKDIYPLQPPSPWSDTDEYLIMDMNLELGDTITVASFSISHTLVVDSVYYVPNLTFSELTKHIRFITPPPFMLEKTEFVEGVGPTLGLRFLSLSMNSYGYLDNFLLCYTRDNIKRYANKQFMGACYPFGNPARVNDIIKDEIGLRPNPVSDQLTVMIPKDMFDKSLGGSYSIISANGKVVARGELGSREFRIDVSSYVPGAYRFILYAKTVQVTEAFYKR